MHQKNQKTFSFYFQFNFSNSNSKTKTKSKNKEKMKNEMEKHFAQHEKEKPFLSSVLAHVFPSASAY